MLYVFDTCYIDDKYPIPTISFLSECAKHCSLCYNETECYECTQGYFLNDMAECESMYSYHIRILYVKLLITFVKGCQ